MANNEATEAVNNEDLLTQVLENPELVAQLKAKLSPETDEATQGIENDKVKENIKKAYQEKEEMSKELESLRQAKRDHELRALEEAGKKDEADQMRMQEYKDQVESLRGQLTGATRDAALKGALAGMEFRSDKASLVAYQDIVGTLIQDASGTWVSPNGQSINDYVQFYAQDDSNSFLFKSKQSSGSSAMAQATNATSQPVSGTLDIKNLSGTELVQAIAEGKFDDGGKWY